MIDEIAFGKNLKDGVDELLSYQKNQPHHPKVTEKIDRFAYQIMKAANLAIGQTLLIVNGRVRLSMIFM